MLLTTTLISMCLFSAPQLPEGAFSARFPSGMQCYVCEVQGPLSKENEGVTRKGIFSSSNRQHYYSGRLDDRASCTLNIDRGNSVLTFKRYPLTINSEGR